MNENLYDAFCAIVGKSAVIREQKDITPYVCEPRGWFHGKAQLVLRPSSTEQVSQIMQLASKTCTPVTPQGGNTGLVGAQNPSKKGDGIILSMERLNKIRKLDTKGQLAIVEAGVILKNLQEVAKACGKLFPLSLASEGSCQVGGNLSSNAGGINVLRYGNMRALCQGLEVVLPDGRILNDLCLVKKNNSGYDLRDLFIGAEGTLGVITAAVLKLFPRAKETSLMLIGLASLSEAVILLERAQESFDFGLTAFEVINTKAMEVSCAYTGLALPFSNGWPWYVLMEVRAFENGINHQQQVENFLEDCLEQSLIKDAVFAKNLQQQASFWRLREEISPAQKRFFASIKHDISLPLSNIVAFTQEADLFIKQQIKGAEIVCFGHLGDGNLHYNIAQPSRETKEEFLAKMPSINQEIHALVVAYGGAFSAEHGIGQLKREAMLAFKDPVALELMQGIKKLFDPYNIMNPDKIFKLY